MLLAWSGGALAQAPTHPWCLSHDLTLEHLHSQGLAGDLADHLPAPAGDLRGGGTPVIPVVFHVVWRTAAENIPDATIQMMLDQMNTDFSATNPELSGVRPAFTSVVGDTDIQFCLADRDPQGNPASGIVRVQTTATWFSPNWQPHDMKTPPLGSSAWDPTRYLNIWVCNIVGNSGNIVSGYTYLPTGGMAGSWQDGLVIDYFYGTTPSARTATHEAGHYFGLRHTFDGNSCFSDDGFADTPNTDNPAWNCNPGMMKCGVLTQYENFMDYSTCLSMFTQQQSSYMRQILFGIRSSLLGSTGCAGISTHLDEVQEGPTRVFPNPARDVLHIHGPGPADGRLELHDLRGRTILTERYLGHQQVLSLAGLAPGSYLLRIFTEQTTPPQVHPVQVQ